MKYISNILNTKTLYKGYHELVEYVYSFSLFNGEMSTAVTRELFKRRACVGLIPYDPTTNKVVLIEQCRLGPLSNNDYPWMYEIVAGIVEDNEEKESTIIRESQEEAGCEINKLIPILEYYMTPGYCNETMQLYCGLVDSDTVDVNKTYGLTHEHEDIKVHLFDLNEAMQMLRDGKINNASTIIALQWLNDNQQLLNS